MGSVPLQKQVMEKMNYRNFLILLMILILAAGCSDFPRDPKHSFEKAKADELNVGLSENHPFVSHNDGHLSGTEIELIEGFARRHNLNIRYTIDSESHLIEQLEKYKLHLVAGGFEKSTIWSSKAGLTVPYDYTHVLLVPKGENKLLNKLEQYIIEVRNVSY